MNARHSLTPFEAAEVVNARRTIEKLFSEEQRLLLIELLKEGLHYAESIESD